MSHYAALLDANVLYPAPMRDVLMQLAVTDIFKAKWEADLCRICKWTSSELRKRTLRSGDRTNPQVIHVEVLRTAIPIPATFVRLVCLCSSDQSADRYFEKLSPICDKLNLV